MMDSKLRAIRKELDELHFKNYHGLLTEEEMDGGFGSMDERGAREAMMARVAEEAPYEPPQMHWD